MKSTFNSIYSHGFVRAAVCIPSLRVADPVYNLERTFELARRASELNAAIALFPELGISAYSNEDLFHQDALLEAAYSAVERLVQESEKLVPMLIVGLPLRFDGKLFNCAVIVYRGRVLGIVPKTYLPNYREFYEKRQFTSARAAIGDEVAFLGERSRLETIWCSTLRMSRALSCMWKSARMSGRLFRPAPMRPWLARRS